MLLQTFTHVAGDPEEDDKETGERSRGQRFGSGGGSMRTKLGPGIVSPVTRLAQARVSPGQTSPPSQLSSLGARIKAAPC